MRALGAIVPVALRRLRAQWALYCCALIALTLAVALAALVPLYTEGASLRLLERELAQAEMRSGRSPFALLIRFLAADGGAQSWARIQPVDELMRGPTLPFLGLPIDNFVRHGRSAPLPLSLATLDAPPQALGSVTLGFLDGIAPALRLLDGNEPQPFAPGAPADVLVARSFANRAGLNVGDTLTLRAPTPILLRVAGIWEPANAEDSAWFYAPDAFDTVMLLPEASFAELLNAQALPVDQVVWFIQMRATGLTPTQAAPLLRRLETLGSRVAGWLPGTRIEQGPITPLTSYRQLATALLLQLGVLAVAPLALAALFLVLVAGALARRQQGEVALLKTRGVRSSQILGFDVTVWLLLGAVALMAGMLLGTVGARLLGRVRSFLIFDDAPPLVLSWSGTAVLFGLAALGVGLLAALLPAWRATRRTLLQEQRQQSRVERPPFWQRTYLDLVLLALGAYGLFTANTDTGGGYTDPLRVLLPLVLTLGFALLVVRLLPPLFAVGATLAFRTRSIVALIVLRTLARQPGTYRSVVLLLIVTISIATVSAALARTLDAELATAIAYQVGTDTQLIETGEQQQQESGETLPPGEARFLFVPVSAHRDVPGVRAAARVGRFDATLQLGGAAQPVQLIGIDRHDFADVARWNSTWAGGQTLNPLLNQLATRPQAVIVSRAVAERGVRVGDPIALDVIVLGERRPVRGQVAAVVDLWPGVYPEDRPFVIANLTALFEQLGDQYPYDVWITRDPAVPLDEVVSGVRRLGVLLVDARDHDMLLAQATTEPRRQGLFGMLSLGFGAAALLTLIGFVLIALLNARQRTIELGVMAAIGLRREGLVAALALEQGLLVCVGAISGGAIGSRVAALTVPLLRVGVGPYPGTPPTPPVAGGDATLLIYAAGGAALLLAVLALALAAAKLQLTQAVRLGDAPE